MQVVDPSERVCLFLEPSYMPRNILTARAAFYHTYIKQVGHGLDLNGNRITLESTENDNIVISPDQPVMRSAHKVWIIPTVFVANEQFFYRKKDTKKSVSLADLYRAHKGICQICLQRKPINEFSREHVFPKSKGGTDHVENLTLTCKKCNSIKSDIYPYYNIKGHLLKPKNFGTPFFMPDEHEMREEWLPFLFQEKTA